MSADNDLVLDWAADYQSAVAAGRPADLAVICQGRPDLIPAVEQLLRDAGQLADVGRAIPPPEADTDPMPVALGRYDLLHELGQGAFGVAYRGRDTQLSRDVAVKLLRRKWAGNDAVARRFLDEARVTAQLQHPSIPAVHEVGESADGRPWIAMKLIRGHTLHDLLKANDPSLNRLAVFEAVCQGLSYAHSKGVIHRDLKPENVMVGAFGEVQVMDWGLAKVLGTAPAVAGGTGEETAGTAILSDRESDGTRAGSHLGTPAYMAPEQAIGAVDRVDCRSDVFGLGGILCRLLTGKPPFVGGDAESTRQLAALGRLADAFARLDACGADPELVALCKRCLSPEKGDRPADAGEVATAVATLRAAADERARRAEVDKAKAEVEANEERRRRTLTRGATIAVLVTLVVGAAVSLAFAFDARKEADRANEKQNDAETATADAKREKLAAIAARTETQRTLAKALLGPLVPYNLEPLPTARPPRQGEQRLSDYEQDAIWALVAQRDGPVGLLFQDEATRTVLASAQFRNRAAILDHAAIGLDAAKRRRADSLLAERVRDAAHPLELRRNVVMVRVSAGVSEQADVMVDVLVAASDQATHELERRALARALTALAGRLPPERATELLATTFGKATSGFVRREFSRGLASAAGGLSPEKAADVCGRAAGALVSPAPKAGASEWVETLEELAGVGMTPAERVAEVLANALAQTVGVYERRELARGLSAVAGKLTPELAARVCGQAAAVLATALAKVAGDAERHALAYGLVALTGKMSPETAAEVLATALANATSTHERRELAEGLASATRRLPRDTAIDVSRQAVAVLTAALAKASAFEHRDLARGLSAFTGQLPPETAAGACGRAAEVLAGSLTKTASVPDRFALAEGLAALAGGMPPDAAAELLATTLGKAAHAVERRALAFGLVSAAARRLPPEKAAELLATTLEKAVDSSEVATLAEGLSAAVSRLPLGTATKIGGRAAEVLVTALGKSLEGSSRRFLAERLVEVGGRLPPETAAELLTTALGKAAHSRERRALALGLASVAGRLPPDAVASVCGRAAEVLARDFAKAANTADRSVLAEGLASVAGRLPTDIAAEVCGRPTEVLADDLAKASNSSEVDGISRGLSALADRLPSGTATAIRRKAAQDLVANLGKSGDGIDRQASAEGLLALACNMPSETATELLLSALGKPTEFDRRGIVERLSDLAGKLLPDSAAPVRGRTAVVLATVLANTANTIELRGLSEDLRCLVLGTDIRWKFSTELAALIGGVTLHPGVRPKPQPLPPQQLVELLKHPFVVLQVRRGVLDALEFTYGRKFADLWDFVAFAEKDHPELDLLTPPRRERP